MQGIRRGDGKMVGQLGNDGVFRKKVLGSKHLFRKYDAWGLDKSILEGLPEGTEIRIQDAETKQLYKTTREHWIENGSEEHYAGHSRQVFLPRKLFNL